MKNYDTTEKYYVYEYVDPDSGKVRYVGKGQGRRDLQHLTDKEHYVANKRFHGYLNNLRKQNKIPIIRRIAENLSEKDAYTLEEKTIKKYGRVGYDENGTLFNHCESGEPPIHRGAEHPWYGRNHTEETKKKQSAAKMGNTPWNKGKKGIYSEDTLSKMKASKNTEEHKKRARENIKKSHEKQIGRPRSEEFKKKLSQKIAKTYEITWPDGHIEIVTNISEFGKRLGWKGTGNISHVVAGRLNHYKGFKAKLVANIL